MQYGGMEVIDCNNHVKSATKFFGPSCAVNSLITKFNPVGEILRQIIQMTERGRVCVCMCVCRYIILQL